MSTSQIYSSAINKKHEFKLLPYQNSILDILLEKELINKKKYTNYWFKCVSGIGKSTIMCELIKTNKQDKTLIICNKWNIKSWKHLMRIMKIIQSII